MALPAPSPSAPPLARTLLACALLMGLMVVAFRWLTLDFEAWTFEDRRQALAAQGKLKAAPVDGLDHLQSVWRSPWGASTQHGQVAIVDFVFTRCDSVCTALGGVFGQMQEELGRVPPRAAIQLVSISFDPRDQAPELKAYAARYRASAPTWRVVRIGRDEKREALLQSLGVVAISDGLGGFVHNGALHVIDRQGKVRGLFDYADWPQATALARQLAASP